MGRAVELLRSLAAVWQSEVMAHSLYKATASQTDCLGGGQIELLFWLVFARTIRYRVEK